MSNNILCAALLALALSNSVGAAEAAPAVNLDNLLASTHPQAAWSDRHSNITLTWQNPGDCGLQMFTSLVGWAGTEITPQLLSWTLTEDGKALPIKLKTRNYRPDMVVEVDTTDGLELTAAVSCPVRNGLTVEFTLVNQTAKPRTIQIGFNYPGKGVLPDWIGPCPAPKCFSLENEPEGSWSTLYIHNEHGRNYLWPSGFVAGMTQGTTLEMVCLADLSQRTLRPEPNGKASLVVAMGFGRYRGLAREVLDQSNKKIAAGWTSAEETKRWQEILGKALPLAGKYRGQEKYERMYAHAVAALTSLSLRGEGGYTGDKRLPYVTKRFLAIAFFWDTSFTTVGLREFDPQLAQEAILCFTENAGPRGSLPGTLCDSHRAGEGQAPIMTWGAWSIYQRSKDKEWLGRVYPVLAGNARFWFKYHCTPRGLCQFFNAGQIADDDVRFDAIQKGTLSCQDLTGFESPDINAFLVMDTRCLALMARELGKPEEAQAWQAKSDTLGKLIVDTMYFPEDAMFHDVKTGTHEKFSDVKTPNMFLPLWAGVPLPPDQVKAVVEKHMLNPNEFFRELPFPSVSYDNPKYNPTGYWRGCIWPHVVYWMIQTLWRQGYHTEAELCADRLLTMLQKTPYLHENYESSEGKAIGSPDYNWSCATAIELLLERYKDPMP